MAKRTAKKAEKAAKVTAPITKAEPQISKDPNAPWHEVKERYGNKIQPKYQEIKGTGQSSAKAK